VRTFFLMASFLALLAVAPTFAQSHQTPQPVVQVAISPNDPTVGDHIQVTLLVKVQESALTGEPRFPAWRETWGEAEIVEKGKPEKVGVEGGIATWQQRLVLVAFRPGEVPLPPANAVVALPMRDRTVQARVPAGLALGIRSVLPRGEKEPQPKPAAPPRPLPIGEAFWWTLAVMSAICLALGWLLWRRRRTAEPGTAEQPALAPFEELVGELDRIAGEPSAVQVHARLSLALRRYLGRSLSFRAPESTTSEIQRRLVSRRMPPPLARRTVELLRSCDMVKFARQSVGAERTRERLDAAREVAREFEMQLRPAEPEQLLEKAG
jgi:hypothetical protein